MTARIAVLASGGGTNLQAILDFLQAKGEKRSENVVLVASDRSEAGALERARRAAVPAAVLKSTRAPDGCNLTDLLREHRKQILRQLEVAA